MIKPGTLVKFSGLGKFSNVLYRTCELADAGSTANDFTFGIVIAVAPRKDQSPPREVSAVLVLDSSVGSYGWIYETSLREVR